jgi:hypothetical protein
MRQSGFFRMMRALNGEGIKKNERKKAALK